MRAPQRKRPPLRKIQAPSAGVNSASLANRVSYVGSPEHKSTPSFAGEPRPRADASLCDPSLAGRLGEIQRWLRSAFEAGCVGGPWDGEFPRYAWCKVGDTVYEARLVNRGLGQYKGWQLREEEWPDGINNIRWQE